MVLSKDAPHMQYKSLFGPQYAPSGRFSASAYSFGTGTSDALRPSQPSATPGPGQYNKVDRPSTTGHPVWLRWSSELTTRNTFQTPMYSFQGTPGPGAYEGPLVGRMQRQEPPSAPPRFGWMRASSRESQQRAYVSREHEREALGLHSPGPHTVGPECFSSLGRQLHSARRTQPRFARQQERRFFRLKATDTSQTPGPGSYDI